MKPLALSRAHAHALTAADADATDAVAASLPPLLFPCSSLSRFSLSSAAAIACTAVTAAVHTTSSTLAPLLRSFTGATRPWSTGPTAAAPVACCTALYEMLPLDRSGKTRTLALPATSKSVLLSPPPSFRAAVVEIVFCCFVFGDESCWRM